MSEPLDQHEKLRDRLADRALRELLSGETPPDLSASILSASKEMEAKTVSTEPNTKRSYRTWLFGLTTAACITIIASLAGTSWLPLAQFKVAQNSAHETSGDTAIGDAARLPSTPTTFVPTTEASEDLTVASTSAVEAPKDLTAEEFLPMMAGMSVGQDSGIAEPTADAYGAEDGYAKGYRGFDNGGAGYGLTIESEADGVTGDAGGGYGGYYGESPVAGETSDDVIAGFGGSGGYGGGGMGGMGGGYGGGYGEATAAGMGEATADTKGEAELVTEATVTGPRQLLVQLGVRHNFRVQQIGPNRPLAPTSSIPRLLTSRRAAEPA